MFPLFSDKISSVSQISPPYYSTILYAKNWYPSETSAENPIIDDDTMFLVHTPRFHEVLIVLQQRHISGAKDEVCCLDNSLLRFHSS